MKKIWIINPQKLQANTGSYHCSQYFQKQTNKMAVSYSFEYELVQTFQRTDGKIKNNINTG